jgi:hypothetical protein
VLRAAQRSDGSRHRIIITEAGLTRAYGHPQNPDEGWLNRDETLDENRYWESLAWYNTLLDQDDVLGACLYQVGHRGDWGTFRHLGADNHGRTLHLIDRIVALREGAAPPPASTAPTPPRRSSGPATLTGTVTLGGRPAGGAVVRVHGDQTTLGSVRGAVLDAPGAVSWSRPVTGFAGALRTAWDRFVAGEVAAFSWADFKRGAPIANPTLAETGGAFVTEQRYFLPENTAVTPAFLWDRRVAGYRGTLRQAWLDMVQGKVLGMSYTAFRRQFIAYNPAVAQSGGRLLAHQPYLLPRSVGDGALSIAALASPRGRFRLGTLPAGDYTVTVEAPGAQPLATALTVTGQKTVELVLQPLVAARPPAGAHGPAAGAGASGSGDFVGTAGREFIVKGRVLRFIGVNLRGLVWYGSGRTLPHSSPGHRNETLDRAREMGVRVARVFLPGTNASTQETISRLGEALAIAGERGIYLLPAFVDFYSTTDFRIPGDDHFYRELDPNFRIGLLIGDFYRGGYRERYLPFVRAVVDAFKHDPRIFAWEVGNELKFEPANQDPGRATFLDFMHTVAREVKGIAPNHLVTTGMISTSHASLDEGDLWRRLYGGPEFDFLTVHCYNEAYAGKQDYDYARVLNKPFIVEEAGFGRAKPGDRVEQIRRDMDRWFGFGASGYMQWGYMPVEGDIGDGDDDAGMDRKWHGGHYEGLFHLYRERAAALQAQADSITPVRPAPPPPPPPPPSPPPVDLPAFAPGTTVFALTAVRVRHTPGYLGKEESDTVAALGPGQAVTIAGGQESRDGLTWWRVRFTQADGTVIEGWAAQATTEAVLLTTALPAGASPGTSFMLMG